MANYAILDENNIVINVISGVEETETIDGLDTETYYGNQLNARCVRTSYNTIGNTHKTGGVPFRKNFAQIGYKYDEVGFFNITKPFESWTFNTDTYLYDSPIPKPITSGTVRNWNPETLTWDEITVPWVLDWDWNESEQNWKIVPLVVYDENDVSVDPFANKDLENARKYYVYDQSIADRWVGVPVPPQTEERIAARAEAERVRALNLELGYS